MEILADLQICEEAYQKLAEKFALQRYNSGRYRFTDIALQRNFDVQAAIQHAREHNLPVDIIDTSYAVHIKDRRVDKGTGLRRVAERMGVDLRDFAAIGDSHSDLAMFELAGFRAAVANACQELKDVSDFVAQARYGEGFAEIVGHMIKEDML